MSELIAKKEKNQILIIKKGSGILCVFDVKHLDDLIKQLQDVRNDFVSKKIITNS